MNPLSQIDTIGCLPIQHIKNMVNMKIIDAPLSPISSTQFQPNSLDLRLGEVAYRVRSSFLPHHTTVERAINRWKQYEIPLNNGAILEPNTVYIIPLMEQLNLPLKSSPKFKIQYPIAGHTNPKSSTGRLDIFTRVICDYCKRFDDIESGYKGKLYLEVVPGTFPIKIHRGDTLCQLRLHHGYTEVQYRDIKKLHKTTPLIFNNKKEPIKDISSMLNYSHKNSGLCMRVNLKPNHKNEVIAYKAKLNCDTIDLKNINYYNIKDFWEPIYHLKNDELIIIPKSFYIFMSKERIRIPPKWSAEMLPYDTGSGELRIHYAGFFDSGFGGDVKDGGAHAVLEVRSHEVPFLIKDGQPLGTIYFHPNIDIPQTLYGQEKRNHYQYQQLKLSKHFKIN